jgi:hypothetical protein
MEYYEKNKEHCQALQRYYYHKNKYNPKSSCYLEHRLKLQRKAYWKRFPYVSKKGPYSRRLPYPFRDEDYSINRGNYIISFE